MKKKLLLLFLAALLLCSCRAEDMGNDPETGTITGTACESGTDGKDNRSPADTTGKKEDDRPGDAAEVEKAEGKVGKIAVSVTDSALRFTTGGVTFSSLFTKTDGYRTGSGTLQNTKSGSAKVSNKSEKGVTVTDILSDRTQITADYAFTETGVTYTQKVTGATKGIASVFITLQVPDSENILLPYQNGIRISKSNTSGCGTYEYQYGLQMQMFVIEGKNGGAVVYADDDCTQFKNIDVSHSSGYFYVRIETVPQAPFTKYTEFTAVPWKIVPYEGDWTSATALYRDFVWKKFGMEDCLSAVPSWTNDIRMVFSVNALDKATLSALASRVDASEVLIQVADWRKELYDVNWPDYTPRSGVRELIDYAHSLGFRVQLHCNIFGCEMTQDIYKTVGKYHTKNCYNGAPYNMDFSDSARHYKFAIINTASAEWRKTICDNISAAVKATGADAIHLDQSLISYNDRNGYIDGMTSLQGTVLLHKELLAALPEGCALGGEGITDMNARYGTFLQSHVYALDSGAHTWSTKNAEQIVPLTTSVYTQLKTYQWPGLPMTSDADYYLAWFLLGTATGHQPSLWREFAATLNNSEDSIMQMVLTMGKFFTDYDLTRVYSGWKSSTLMRWQRKDGKFAVMKTDRSGYVFLTDDSDENSVLFRILHGVNTAKVTGVITGNICYDEDSVFGLDPSGYYVVLAGDKTHADETHITSLTKNVILTSYNAEKGTLSFGFTTRSKEVDTVTFTLYTKENVSGVYSASGSAAFTKNDDGTCTVTAPIADTVHLLTGGDALALPCSLFNYPNTTYKIARDGSYAAVDTTKASSGTFAGKLRKNVAVQVGARSSTALEYILSLPEQESITLEFLVGTNDALPVSYPVSAEINGETVWNGTVSEKGTSDTYSVDLSGYAGKTVVLRLTVDGTHLDGATRKFLWSNLTVR